MREKGRRVGEETKTCLGNVYPLPLSHMIPTRQYWWCEAHMLIENYEKIGRFFGSVAARQVHTRVLERMQRALGLSGLATPGRDGAIDIVAWEAPSGEGLTAAESAGWLEGMARDIALAPVMTRSGAIHASIGLASQKVAVPAGDESVGSDAGIVGADVIDGEGLTYRSDMAAASSLLGAICRGRQPRVGGPCAEVGVMWRPVASTAGDRALRIYEASLGLIDTTGQVDNVDSAIASTERLGFVHLVDRYLVSAVIDELLDAPDSIAMSVTVSAVSLQPGEFWDRSIARLNSKRAAASRLIIEVRGSSNLCGGGEVHAVISRLRSIGCKLSIGGFGVGVSSLRDLVALRPDFITVARQFFANAGLLDPDERAIAHLVGLAQALGSEVVIDGIDSEDAVSSAVSAGATFHKGIRAGLPRQCRPWAIGCSH